MSDILGANPNGIPEGPIQDAIAAAQRKYANEVKDAYDDLDGVINKAEQAQIVVEDGSYEDIMYDSMIAVMKAMQVLLKGNMPIDIGKSNDVLVEVEGDENGETN